MIIDDFDVSSAIVRPTKAYTILQIDSNRVLAGAVAPEFFKMVRWIILKERQIRRMKHLIELSAALSVKFDR